MRADDCGVGDKDVEFSVKSLNGRLPSHDASCAKIIPTQGFQPVPIA